MVTLQFRTTKTLAPGEIADTFLTLRSLYTKCWLIQQDRFDDLVEYDNTGNSQFEEEAGLQLLCGYSLAQVVPVGIELTLQAPASHDEKVMLAVRRALEALGWVKVVE